MSKVRYAHVLHCARQRHKSTVNIPIIPTLTNPCHRTPRARRPYGIHPPDRSRFLTHTERHRNPIALARPRATPRHPIAAPSPPRRTRLSTTHLRAPRPPREIVRVGTDDDGTAHTPHRASRPTLAAAARARAIASPHPTARAPPSRAPSRATNASKKPPHPRRRRRKRARRRTFTERRTDRAAREWRAGVDDSSTARQESRAGGRRART